ncbi:cyclase family protein [Pantoea phytobeneficialis]|uniref:Cyclase family protein n=2 Tax=Pantoea phytobeneficialis TaxID=2052056 RepID=A0ABT8Y2F1_9GAMM|nr:cyclase family protein [Pantoea phytobeneficialis]MDO6409904.1 cyclase family protein [Pantoea phytobeneficialis]
MMFGRIITFTIILLTETGMFCGAALATTLPPVKEYIELNHPLHENMTTYPGLSEVELYTRLERGKNGAIIDGIKLLGISGTYIDAPFHADPHGKKISDYDLRQLVNLPVVIVRLPPGEKIFFSSAFQGKNVAGKAVLLMTGRDRLFGTEAYSDNPPYLSAEGAKWLAKNHAALVGIDSVLIDNYNDASSIPAHDILLKNNVVVAEDMTNIGSLMGKNAYLTAVPPRVPMASFPARIFAAVY